MCGGTRLQALFDRIDSGLSPRVRGNLDGGRDSKPYEGSIPACAGEPIRTSAQSAKDTVYPRVCGGTALPRLENPSVRGLSPRVRGNRRVRAFRDQPRGSIPACAGEPHTGSWYVCQVAVYPRVCGGTQYLGANLHGDLGLSPRVRGNPGMADARDGRVGSIPACAGEPPSCG